MKPPDDKEETMEEKQQRVSKYESMQICSALLPSNSDRLESGDVSSESTDIGPCVMCVARRIPPNEKPTSTPIATPIEQFTVRLDPSGKIIAVDLSWLSPPYSTYLGKVRVRKNSSCILSRNSCSPCKNPMHLFTYGNGETVSTDCLDGFTS